MSDTDLRNADLSDVAIADMTPEQRAEMKRRYEDFVRTMIKAAPKNAARRRATGEAKPWVPTKRKG
jgi:hypothetical protein